ncbi:MAG: GNAT family N-acetyltransferase [Solirubrobacterales bacterium]|nr:GNAT family N-acetyltransferase [Solirubrobacterales bacterium]
MSLVEELAWDSSFFGFPIGKVAEGIAVGDVEAATKEADQHALRCVYMLVAADDHALLDSSQRHGFLVRDVRVELARRVEGHPATLRGLRRGSVDDLERLAPIARERFAGTRFHADSGFPRGRSADLYVQWLRRGLAGEGSWLALVAEDYSGFVVCDLGLTSGTGSIGLLGVAADAAGRGVGSSLLAGAGAVFTEAALTTAQVVTQAHNIAAQRLYQANGYRTARTQVWLHRWRD